MNKQIQMRLIELHQPHPELWDAAHPDFKKNTLKRSSWVHIYKTLTAEFPQDMCDISMQNCIDKISSMMSYFKKVYNNLKKTSTGQQFEIKCTNLWYYEKMRYLIPTIGVIASTSDSFVFAEEQSSSSKKTIFETI